jgi:hypothetical protein
VFLYDYQTQTADQLDIRIGVGSISFGNPTIEEVQVGGRPALVMTLLAYPFLYSCPRAWWHPKTA